jgi:hypothetical protein
MTANALRLWGAKRLRPAVEAATGGRITDATVYTLRHSHASACHYVSNLTEPEIYRRLVHGHQADAQPGEPGRAGKADNDCKMERNFPIAPEVPAYARAAIFASSSALRAFADAMTSS